MPRPCRAAKGLECVFPIWFTQCGRVWFTLAMPRPCLVWPCRCSQGHSTARPSRDGRAVLCCGLENMAWAWHTEQQSVLLYSIAAALQLTLIANHHFSNHDNGLQRETPSLHCDCLRLWQLHSKTLCYFWTPALYVFNSMRRKYRVNDLLCLCPAHLKICRLFRNREILFWIEQKCSALSCEYYDVSRYEMRTHPLPLKQHHLISFLVY